VVEDHPLVARSLERFFERYGTVRVTGSLRAAEQAFFKDPDRWDAIVIDVGLPDGSGMDLLEEIRRRGRKVPALVLTANVEAVHMRRAQLFQAFFLPKPTRETNLMAFVEWALRHHGEQARLRDVVGALAVENDFTERELEIVLLSAKGHSRDELCDLLAIAPETLKTQTRSLLRKTDHQTMSSLVRSIHLRVFGDAH
jgi:DNA-binding NarL/FixJ family response regulator